MIPPAATLEIEPVATAAGGVDGKPSLRAFVPPALEIANKHVSIVRLTTQVTVGWSKVLKERVKTP